MIKVANFLSRKSSCCDRETKAKYTTIYLFASINLIVTSISNSLVLLLYNTYILLLFRYILLFFITFTSPHRMHACFSAQVSLSSVLNFFGVYFLLINQVYVQQDRKKHMLLIDTEISYGR